MNTGNGLSNKSYLEKIRYETDPDSGEEFCFINIPEELLEQVSWKEGTELNLDIKLGPKGNVLVLSKLEAI